MICMLFDFYSYSLFDLYGGVSVFDGLLNSLIAKLVFSVFFVPVCFVRKDTYM